MPTKLDNVSATVNGKPAFVYFISPLQVNILTPPDALSGTAQVEVTLQRSNQRRVLRSDATALPFVFRFQRRTLR